MSEPLTGEPTEEQMRAYLESLKAAQPVEIVVQSFGILATSAEVKLGQPDARILIDGMAALLDATAAHMPSEIVSRMRQTVSQLQMAQVQAERERTTASTQPSPDEAAGEEAAAQRETPQPETPQRGSQQQDVTSRLWIPGRD